MATKIAISRNQALASDSLKYFTGKPCIHGHISERYTSTAKCVACALGQYIAWRSDHPDFLRRLDLGKKRLRDQCYLNAHRAERRAKDRARYAADPSKKIADDIRRRARKAAAEGCYTAADIERIASLQRHRCAWCQASIRKRRHIDHIVPLIKNGSNWPNNLQLLCPPCNLRKNRYDPLEWARMEGRLL